VARAVVGFWPANSVGDDIEVYAPSGAGGAGGAIETTSWPSSTPCASRWRSRPADPTRLSPISWRRPSSASRLPGRIRRHGGHRRERLAESFEAANDDYRAIMVKALADRLAEATAEYLHAQVRRELWGYARGEALDKRQVIGEEYQGIRPAPGYPACPDHTEKATLFALLDAEARAG
jgi:5-methyltetrahydrofolate--homocysteine methyltransferase